MYRLLRPLERKSFEGSDDGSRDIAVNVIQDGKGY